VRIGAGQMDRRITLRRATITQNAFGEAIAVWGDLTTVPAHFMPVSDSERYRSDEMAADITSRFRIRWSATTGTVTPRDRLTYQGREYDIHGVKEMGRRDFLEITASARAES
jgi:SPP1 family predicted phage head-tail adaptor